jgi:lipopolysaccharide export system permease protein
MITRLDRYVGRMFIMSWVVSVVFFVGLFGVYDVFANIDELMEQVGGSDDAGTLGVTDIVELYLYQMPGILLKVAPFVMVMSALVAVLRLQRHNEFMAMVLIGRSPRRVLRPVVALTVLFVAGLVVVQERVAPAVAVSRDQLRATLIEGGKERLVDVQTKDSEGKLFVARGYNASTRTIGRLNVSYSDAGRDVVISGEQAIWDEASGGWLLDNGRSVVTRADQPAAEDDAPFVRTDLRPEDLMVEVLGEFDLPYERILERSERYPLKRSYRMLRHYHVTFPISVLLLVLLVLPFVVRGSPQARMRGLGVAVLSSLAFFILDTGARQMGTDGQLQPVVAAWLPVILLGSVIVVMQDTAEG